MTSKKVLSKYEDLLGKQIDRLKKEFGGNEEKYSTNCPVCADEIENISCQEKLVTGATKTLKSPEGFVSPQLEHQVCPLESRHAARHFDDFTQRPDAKKALSLEQSCSVGTPCPSDSLPYEETALHGSLFEACEHSDEGKRFCLMKLRETDMAKGSFIERGLNSDRWSHADSKEDDNEEIFEDIETGGTIVSPDSTETADSALKYRESSLSRMKAVGALRDRKQKEWIRDVAWLREDVQDYTLAAVNTTERQKILDSVRSRFSRLSKDLNKLVHYSTELGANRYHYENSKNENMARRSEAEPYQYKDINFADEINEPIDRCLITANEMQEGMESLRQKVELKYQLHQDAPADDRKLYETRHLVMIVSNVTTN